jgi:hypothetical protein
MLIVSFATLGELADMHVFEPLSPLEQFVDIVKRCPVAKEKKNITRDGKIYDWPVRLPSPKKTTQSTNLPPSELVPGRISRGETSPATNGDACHHTHCLPKRCSNTPASARPVQSLASFPPT